MERHLDDAALRALEARDVQAVTYFRDHLSRPCAECEAFLADAPARLWWLEAEADRLLHLHGALAAAAPDTSGFRAVRRAMRARRMRKAIAVSLAGSLAVAAALLLTVTRLQSGTSAGPDPLDGVKGRESGVLELAAVRVTRAGATVPMDRGRARPSDTVALRYVAGRAGPAWLVKSGPDGQPVALGEFQLSTGKHDLSDSGGVVGVSMEGEQGDVRLWLVQSSGPLTAAGAVDALQAATAGVSVIGVLVHVSPGDD